MGCINLGLKASQSLAAQGNSWPWDPALFFLFPLDGSCSIHSVPAARVYFYPVNYICFVFISVASSAVL